MVGPNAEIVATAGRSFSRGADTPLPIVVSDLGSSTANWTAISVASKRDRRLRSRADMEPVTDDVGAASVRPWTATDDDDNDDDDAALAPRSCCSMKARKGDDTSRK